MYTEHQTPKKKINDFFSVHRTPNAEHLTPNTEYQTPNTEHQTLNTEHKAPNTKHWTLNTNSKHKQQNTILNTEYNTQNMK